MQLAMFPELEPASLRDLVRNTKDVTYENIKHLKNIELEVISKLMGIPSYGTKAQQIYRILDLWDLRHTLAEYDSDHEGMQKLADFYRRVELHDMCRRAKAWKSGNKKGLAAALLGWRNLARHKGQKFLNEIREHLKERKDQNEKT